MKEQRYSIGRLMKESGLARSSLLNYESLGLIKPAGRSAAGYRVYAKSEIERLQKIRQLRAAGLSLEAIGELLSQRDRAAVAHPRRAKLIEHRLFEVAQEIDALRQQQVLLASLLASREFRRGHRYVTKQAWVKMLASAGFTEEQMHRWHIAFEADRPQEHAEFLHSLGLSASEVVSIRRWSRAPMDATS